MIFVDLRKTHHSRKESLEVFYDFCLPLCSRQFLLIDVRVTQLPAYTFKFGLNFLDLFFGRANVGLQFISQLRLIPQRILDLSYLLFELAQSFLNLVPYAALLLQ